MFLSFYLDESGIHEGSPHVVVAGLVGPQNKWIAFEKKWRELLDCWGLDFFHMSDFESYYGPYSSWTKEQHRSRLDQLLDVIGEHVFGYVGFGLSVQDYERAFSEQVRKKLSPYHVLAFHCFHYGNHLIDTMLTMFGEVEADDPTYLEGYETLREFPTALIYEEVGKGAGALLETYQRIAGEASIKKSLHVVSLSYQSKKNFGALQAADILAYELWKDIPRSLGVGQRPKRYPLRRIEEFSKSASWRYFNEEQLKAIVPSLGVLFNIND